MADNQTHIEVSRIQTPEGITVYIKDETARQDATTTHSGLMSASDKIKLNNLETISSEQIDALFN